MESFDNPDKVAAIILECAGTCSHPNVYILDKISQKKERNARASCKIPPEESLLVLIDCTTLGSAKNCLAFTPFAIYGHNDWSGKTPGVLKIPYSEIHSRCFLDGGMFEISLDNKQFLNVAGAGSKSQILKLLWHVKERLTDVSETSVGLPSSSTGLALASAGTSNCPHCKSDSIDRKSELKTSASAHFVGQALFGIVGNLVAGAAFARKIEHCECKSCGYKWVTEKPKG